MNKKIIASLATIAVVAAAAIGGTIAYFSSQQVSTGNIIKAGTIDLQINHTAQTYNGVDCRTCGIELVSNESDWVVEKNDWAKLVTYINPRWTIDLNQPEWQGAKWIWATDPTDPADTTNNVIYTFRKTFEWMGPITGTSMDVAVGSDNSVQVFLNGVMIGENSGEFGYQTPITIPAEVIEAKIIKGATNTLEFKVQNWAGSSGPYANPGGLVYRFNIDGKCDETQYPGFAQACQLWQTGQFDNQKFFNFDDVKPGDWGTNKISLTVTSNDANVCMYVIPTTTKAADVALANYIKFNLKYDGNPVAEGQNISLSNLVQLLGTLPTGNTKYVDVEWCFGNFDIQGNCDGTGNQNDAQGGQILADLGFYAEQTRHNGNFACPQNPFAE